MSIWCSTKHVGTSEFHDEPEKRGGEVLSYANGFSNHHPDLSGEFETPACIDLADIAPWCVPGHDQNGDGYTCSGCGDSHDHPQNGPWLRLGITAPTAKTWWRKDDDGNPLVEPVHADVVLDVAAARQLAADLLSWADDEHLTPTTAPSTRGASA